MTIAMGLSALGTPAWDAAPGAVDRTILPIREPEYPKPRLGALPAPGG